MNRFKAGALISLSSLMLACSKVPYEEQLASAKSSIDGKNSDAAILQLKNTIIDFPENSEPRLILGTLYLEIGDPVLAEKEFNNAIKFGVDESSVVAPLSKSLFLQQKYKPLADSLNKLNKLTDEHKTQVLLYNTIASLQQGDFNKANLLVEQASDIASSSVFTQLSSVYTSLNQIDLEEAIALTDEILAKKPNFDEAQLLRAQILMSSGNISASVEAFKSYQAMVPRSLTAKLLLAYAYTRNGDYDNAEPLLDKLLAVAENQPLVNQLKSIALFTEKDFSNALIYSEKAIQAGAREPINYLIAGLSAYRLENFELSYQNLSKIIQSLPDEHPAQNVFVHVQMLLGYELEAVESISQLESLTADDSSLISSIGIQLARGGAKKNASRVLEVVERIDITDPVELAKVGLLKSLLDQDDAKQMLEDSIGDGAQVPQANIELARIYIKDKQFDKALSLAEEWVKEEPNSLAALNLAALVSINSNKFEDAEKYLQQASVLTSENPLAAMYEAEKLVMDGKLKGATKVLQSYLERQPTYIPAWSRFYALSKQLGNIDSFLTYMNETVDITNDVNLTITLAKYQFIEDFLPETRKTLNRLDSSAALPDLFWYLSARLHLQNDSWIEATSDYQNWQKHTPRLLQPWLFELSVYEKYQQPREGLRRVEAAKRLFPDNTSLIIFESKLNVTLGNLGRAKRLVSSLKQKQGSGSIVDAIEGEIAFKEGRYEDAQSSIEKYYEINPNEKNALLLAELYSQLNQRDVATPFMEEHLLSQPSHYKVRSKLAQLYLATNPQKAVDNYSKLVEVYSSNIVYLNNLAWALSSVNKAEQGLKFIDDAYRLSSSNADILDTYITLLLQLNRKSEARALLSNAEANGVAPEKIRPLINKVDGA